VSGGWLRTERHGRRSRVHLTDDAREMLSSGAQRIYAFGEPHPWQGRWLLILVRVPEERRDVRHLIRSQLAWAGFGSLGNGLWITPHVDREAEVDRIVRDLSVAELLSFRAEFGDIGDPAKVITDAWDLADVAGRYREFVGRFGRLRPKAPESVFRAQTELVHTWRKFPFLDPDLPQEMLPARWPRSRAHDVFAERHAEWHRPAQEYFGSLERLVPAQRQIQAA
jgi:phenylacetic acid degradation operon negative regulatory protein